MNFQEYDKNNDGYIDPNEFSLIEENFQENAKKAKNRAAIAGIILVVGLTLISCFSSYENYHEGFSDLGPQGSVVAALLWCVMQEGSFLYFLYGMSKVFTTSSEKTFGTLALVWLVIVMTLNVWVHFCLIKRLPLNGIQEFWVSWSAPLVFCPIMVLILAVRLSDPMTRAFRVMLNQAGRQQELALNAKSAALNSAQVAQASRVAAMREAEKMADRVLGNRPPNA